MYIRYSSTYRGLRSAYKYALLTSTELLTENVHATYVTSHWSYLTVWTNRVSWFEEHIKNFDSAAIFTTGDNSLVSWIMQYPSRE